MSCARVSYLRNYGRWIWINPSGNLAFMRGGEKSNSEYVWSIDMFLIPCSSDFVQGKRI